MNEASSSPERRSRWTVTVRVLLLLVLAVGTPMGWWARRAQLQKRAVEAIEKAHGSVTYNEEITKRAQNARRDSIIKANIRFREAKTGAVAPPFVSPPSASSRSWKLRLEGILGVDYVANATKVTAFGTGPDREFDLALLAYLPRLKFLSLRHKPLGDDGLRNVAGLHQLRILLLEDTGIGDAGLVHLADLSTLEELGLAQNGSRITDAGLKHLRELPNLDELFLVYCPRVTEAGIAELRRRFPKLVFHRRP